jgi:hypothetical protein
VKEFKKFFIIAALAFAVIFAAELLGMGPAKLAAMVRG